MGSALCAGRPVALIGLALGLAVLVGCSRVGVALPPPSSPALEPGLSDAVARVMDRYPTDGSFGFYWPPDDGAWWGTTRDVWYLGVLVSPGDPRRRSHCVGLTWEVAMEVLQAEAGEQAAINGLSVADLAEFRTDWFVRDLGGAGAADAVERAGVGERVPPGDLRRGDFLQMWTGDGAGHSGVFERWESAGDQVVGIRYWSTHPALGGIGYWTDPLEGHLDLSHVYGARLWPKSRWRVRSAVPG